MLLALGSITSVFGQSNENGCTDVDVRDFQSPEVRKIFSEPRDQGDIGWCFGFAAADLLTAEVGKKVSSAHVAALFNKTASKNFFLRLGYNVSNAIKNTNYSDIYEGGFTRLAVQKAVRMKKVCTEEGLPFETYLSFVKSLDLLQKSIDKKSSFDQQYDSLERIQRLFKFYNLKEISIGDLYNELKEENLNAIVAQQLTDACTEQVDVPDLKVATIIKLVNTKKRFMKHLDRVLDAGKAIGVEYNVKEIVGYSGDHASVLTARRFKDGVCEYKIRNSWGQGCYGYKAGVDCDSKEGSFWVAGDTLHKMLHSINYIKF